MRVLITGAGGQLGHDLQRAFADDTHHEVVPCTRDELDLASRDSVLQAITTVAPDVVVHAGAWTNVDGCETEPDQAWRVNALGTRHVADASRVVAARVVYVSTDYVFDGRASTPYTEWSAVGPLSMYGRSKLGGERELSPSDTIVRTSWVCGVHGANFVKTMLRLAGERDTLTVVDDQHGCPTFTPDLAAAIKLLVVHRLPGVFHVTNQGATTWFAFARAIFAAAGLDAERVQPISTAELQPARPAPRPAYSVLDNAALRLSDLPMLPDWHEPLERMVKELVSS
ncbi:MAG TPA: dTDP-4-dehydrorhamnose reductase [Acidimicrobiales bacterium]|jgi:dTDP-4-dehydrorhamnose reductase|nr:dTDP-4-dehydrorhamnose reductase [Acidimicrobiales bacterium]